MSADDSALRSAAHQLYSTHSAWLRGWLRQRLGCSSDAADLVQDTFVRVIKARQALDIRQPRQYLSTVAKGLMIDLFRRRALEQSYLEALAALPVEVYPSQETRAIVLETLMEIDRMLDSLGDKVRQTFILSQFEGLSYPKIAERLGISLRTVNNHMAKAMEQCCLMRLGLL
ncbi:sigma-70 family RNA polymerase sigma factor [Pseudomonas plecoglossicida]|uniref:sigma-70 family RNA polymerase sigma factor n=1 Tax=Pseudomonas plecoglossicida TaxID=70775 RepID=UPI003D2105A5